MKITITNDFRCFKKDDVFEINFKKERNNPEENRFIFLIGDNGCGKSTLLKSIRKHKTTFAKNIVYSWGDDTKKERNVNLSAEINEISNYTNIEEMDYEVIDALDGELDSPTDWGNCASATDFCDNGGFQTAKFSNGMKSVTTFINWVKSAKIQFVQGKTLILLDEVERGWKIDFCIRILEILNSHFKGCDFIMVSHNPLCCLGAYGNCTFYDVETKSYYKDYKDYFTNKTQMYISLSYIDWEDEFDKILSKLKKENNDLKEEIKILKNEKEQQVLQAEETPQESN